MTSTQCSTGYRARNVGRRTNKSAIHISIFFHSFGYGWAASFHSHLLYGYNKCIRFANSHNHYQPFSGLEVYVKLTKLESQYLT